jgi:two-component system, NarL family, sensor histidine kinase DesK
MGMKRRVRRWRQKMASQSQLSGAYPVAIHRSTPVVLPRMWSVFVAVCLVFILVTAARIVLEFPGVALVAIGLTKVALLISLFLWATLRDSLSQDDITPAGIQRSTLTRRLLWILGMLGIIIALTPVLPEFQLWWLLLYPMVAAGLTLPLVPAKIVIGTLTVASFACAWVYGEGFQPILLTQAVLALGAVIIRMMTVTNIQLEASQNDAAKLAVAEERLRFSRDLHDSLGHSLSTIVLKSELGGRLANSDPERAHDEIRDVERVARDALKEVRSVVAGYRRPTLAREIEVARELLISASIAATVEMKTGDLPPEIDNVLAWGVREGVTNIIRHSGARNCSIRIIEENGTTRLELTDDGADPATNPLQERTGNGLTGLRERVGRAGGWLTAGSQPGGGFKLILETPAITGRSAPS